MIGLDKHCWSLGLFAWLHSAWRPPPLRLLATPEPRVSCPKPSRQHIQNLLSGCHTTRQGKTRQVSFATSDTKPGHNSVYTPLSYLMCYQLAVCVAGRDTGHMLCYHQCPLTPAATYRDCPVFNVLNGIWDPDILIASSLATLSPAALSTELSTIA